MYNAKGSIRKVGSAEEECALSLEKRLRRLRTGKQLCNFYTICVLPDNGFLYKPKHVVTF